MRDRGYGIRVKGSALRHELDIRGVTGADVARCAKVAPSTVSQALNGRRIHPRKLHAIVAALAEIKPIPEMVKLLGKSEPPAEKLAIESEAADV